MTQRLARTTQFLGAPVTTVAVDEVYDESDHLRQPLDADRDFPRAIAKLAHGLKPRTIGTYRPYLGAYWQLCLAHGSPLEDGALFRGFVLAIARHAQRKPSASTIKVVCSAVGSLLVVLGLRSPLHDPATVHWLAAEMMTRARHKPKRADAILSEEIAHALDSTDAMMAAGGTLRLRGLRDRAMILLGWTCALRRSELVSVRRMHLQKTRAKRWELVIPESKTSHGEDHIIPVVPARDARFDTMAAVAAWVSAASIHRDDFLFRRVRQDGSLGDDALHPATVRDVLQVHGLREGFSPHSLRSGFVTQARLNGATNHQIRTVTRHGSDIMVDIYSRPVDPERQGPGALV